MEIVILGWIEYGFMEYGWLFHVQMIWIFGIWQFSFFKNRHHQNGNMMEYVHTVSLKKGLVLLQHHDPQWNSDRPWQTVKQVILPMLLRCFGPRLDTWSVETQGRAPQSTGSFLLSWQWASLGPATQGIARSEGLWRWASRIQTHPSPAETDLEPLKT